MLYLETGKMSWDPRYGMGRYVDELIKRKIYQYVICTKSQESFVPKIEGLKVIALDDTNYREELSAFISKNIGKGDAIHFPANLICANFDSIPKDVKIFLTVHDITPIFCYKNKKKNGNRFSNGERVSTKQFEENLAQFLPRADCIFAVSENTKNDIVSRFGIDANKVVTIYNGIDSRFINYCKEKLEEIKKSYQFENEKLVMALTGMKHKNVKRIVIAYYLYCMKNKNKDLKLLLVGKVNRKMAILTYLLRKKKKIILTGRVSDEALIDYYNIAEGFIFVSLYEGFGLPPLEAMACGSCVVCSKTSSLGELGRGYAHLVNPKSVREISRSFELIKRQSDDEIKRQREYVNQFTWDKSAKRHMEIIENIMKNHKQNFCGADRK